MKRFLLAIAVLSLLAAAPAALAHCGGCEKPCGDKAVKAAHKPCDKPCDGKAGVQMASDKGFCMKSASKAVKEVKNIENGVQILFSADNEAFVESLKAAVKAGKVLSCEGQCPIKARGVKRELKRTDKGVLVTATSPDAEMIQHLQKSAKAMVGA